ncbi:MAG TPA: error-prone DNA polymerase [Steroidobacteraceae bacterium]|nr:error-prone DNA polymerase [Steroidobacteraceae bacterium]
MSYAELHCVSNFTFLRGASHPAELVERAKALGYAALALTDECSLAGIVRAHAAARDAGLQLVVGSEFRLADGLRFVALATSRQGYGALARLITRGRRAAPKGQYRLARADLASGLPECLALWLPGDEPAAEEAKWLRERFEGRLWVAVELLAAGGDRERLGRLTGLAASLSLPAVAAGDVHMHQRRRRALQDVLTATRLGTTVAAAGRALFPNGERCLRPLERLEALYPRPLLDASRGIAERCRFSLDELRYEYPEEIVPPGATPASELRRLVEEGAARRWPGGTPPAVRDLIERELALIAELGYERYFLTVHDLVGFARSRGILCQGRGSAANSAACYALGITEVDPARMSVLFERFLSRERNEPPDIDVDFEHERREEVIQYLYAKYGRARAALTATVICYRPKSAVRDVGKALGLDAAQVDRLSHAMQWWDGHESDDSRIRDAGFDTGSPLVARVLALTRELLGFPRHLSQHTGGFVISRGPLEELVPIENAAMPERTVIQWDKDDLDELGLLKVDVLGLGMLTAIRRALALVSARRGREFALSDIPDGDAGTYEMISRADTVGVFQIESRAQMAMLPRLRPRCYYDLVIEVAIVRPGPIQGQMVHPYLRRRSGEEAVEYPGPEVEHVLKRTLGVPIFQEQVMQLAVEAAGFTPGEADRLRRAMAAWKRRGGLEPFEAKLKAGMRAKGYSEEFADRIYRQILGFGEYGFPESHAASFALLVYASAWLKRHEPAAFCCALLNSQPMGFYAPAQLVRDAREHGVTVLPADVNASAAESTLEDAEGGGTAIRLGLDRVGGLGSEAAGRIVAARAAGPFRKVAEFARRAALGRRDLAALASAGALAGNAGHRHRAGWEVLGVEPALPLVPADGREEGTPLLRAPTEGEDIVADYRSLGFTLERHPLALLRGRLAEDGWLTAAEVAALPDGAPVATGGLVVTRQRPGSAGGVIFVTLEDETGYLNLVVWSRIADLHRKAMLAARLLGVRGRLQREGEIRHVVVDALADRSALLGSLVARSRDFR